MNIDWIPFLLSLKLAFLTTIVLSVIAIPTAYLLSSKKGYIAGIIESILSLPLVLPPTVTGFYFLLLFGSGTAIGRFFESIGLPMVFSFAGILTVSVLYNFPQMFNPIKSGFESIPKNYTDAALSLGKSKTTILFRVLLPNMKPALITGMLMTFAHTLGAFGVLLMVGGSIESKTKVASIAIYHYMDALKYKEAHIYSALLLSLAFILIVLVNLLKKRHLKEEQC